MFCCAAAHHVHFPEDQASEHISEISVESDGNAHMTINVGFLKVNHQYSIRCQIRTPWGSMFSLTRTRMNLLEL
jgi:hypothetical protein